MPVSAPSLCPKCGYVKEHRERCPRCTKDYNKSYTAVSRDKETYDNVYNTTRWKNLRVEVLKRDRGLCVRCFANNRIEKGTVCDHIIEISDGGAIWDINNLQLLCQSCHNKKTAEQAKLRSL